jgi:NRPS condensation-like uncharacterized protein
LSLDAEPILGCSFETDAFKACWTRLPNIERAQSFSIAESTHPAAEMNAFQAEEIPDSGPQAAVVLLRSPERDELGIKLSHVVADGQAVKQYARLLARLYARLGTDPSHMPEPNIGPRPTGEDVWARLTPDQRGDAKKARSYSIPTWPIPFKGRTGRGLTYRTLVLPLDRLAAIKDHGTRLGATVNDMMLAAFFRGSARVFDPPEGVPLSLMCTADLRRYLADVDRLPIGNISMSGSLDVARVDGEGFDETLARIREHMAVWAATCYGAVGAKRADRMARLGYAVTKALIGTTLRMASRSDKTYLYLTNVGIIDEGDLSFGGLVPVGGHMFGPAAIGGSGVATVSTCNDALTVCMGFCDEDTDSGLIDDVLGHVDEELVE